MMSFTTQAVILRFRDVGETDRIYTFYTKERGMIDVIARGIRKQESKLRATLQFVQLLDIYVIAQRRFTLGGVTLAEIYTRIYQSLERLWAAQHVLELVSCLTRPDHHDPAVFALLKQAFRSLDAPDTLTVGQCIGVSLAFDMQLLEHLGFKPQLYGEDDAHLFALRSDGLYDARNKQQSGIRISAHTRDILRFCQSRPIAEILGVSFSKFQAAETLRAMRVLLRKHDVLPLQTDRMLVDMWMSKNARMLY